MSKIVVAVDLGTSRSAWAFSIEGRAENNIVIRVPEGSLSSVSGTKTETAVLLKTDTGEFLSFGRAARERFIQEAEENEWVGVEEDEGKEDLHSTGTMLFRWFKFVLCQRRGYKHLNEPIAAAEGGQQMPLMHFMTETLQHFKEDALSHLSFVSAVPQRVEDVTWVVTIPATFDDFAKRFMRHAAYKAGITPTVDSPRLQLCLEPEAACLAVSVSDAPALCAPGMQIMILDCGGGTVDITLHEIISMVPLRLKELLPPIGGPWGSTCVDETFKRWMHKFLGADNFEGVRHSSALCALLTQWEDGKTRFCGGREEQIRLNLVEIARHLGITDATHMQNLRDIYNNSLQASPDLHVKGGKFFVILPSALVTSFFDPTLARIAKCLRGLKNEPALSELQYVYLVGGFSSSPLVQSVARNELEGDGCCVVVGTLRPDVAIVRGAVLFANNTDVFNLRKARLTYGVRSTSPYDSEDLEHVRRRLPGRPLNRYGMEIIDSFSRHIEVGDDVPLNGACEMQRYAPLSATQSELTVKILGSHKRGILFPDSGISFIMGEVTVPLDMTQTFADRGILVQFIFGGTEFSVNCFHVKTKEKIANATLSLFQDVQEIQ